MELFLFTWGTMANNLHAQLLHFFSNVGRMYPAHIYEVNYDKHRAHAKFAFKQKAGPYYLQDGILEHQGKRYCLKTVSKMCCRPVIKIHLPEGILGATNPS